MRGKKSQQRHDEASSASSVNIELVSRDPEQVCISSPPERTVASVRDLETSQTLKVQLQQTLEGLDCDEPEDKGWPAFATALAGGAAVCECGLVLLGLFVLPQFAETIGIVVILVPTVAVVGAPCGEATRAPIASVRFWLGIAILVECVVCFVFLVPEVHCIEASFFLQKEEGDPYGWATTQQEAQRQALSLVFFKLMLLLEHALVSLITCFSLTWHEPSKHAAFARRIVWVFWFDAVIGHYSNHVWTCIYNGKISMTSMLNGAMYTAERCDMCLICLFLTKCVKRFETLFQRPLCAGCGAPALYILTFIQLLATFPIMVPTGLDAGTQCLVFLFAASVKFTGGAAAGLIACFTRSCYENVLMIAEVKGCLGDGSSMLWHRLKTQQRLATACGMLLAFRLCSRASKLVLFAAGLRGSWMVMAATHVSYFVYAVGSQLCLLSMTPARGHD